jgi:flagellar hook-associated protein 3 FlgL
MLTSRVSTAGQAEALLNALLQTQNNLAQAQAQVSTGDKSPTYEGLSPDVSTLSGAQSTASETQNYLDTNAAISNTLSTYDTALTGLGSIAASLKNAVTQAIANNSGTGLITTVKGLLSQAVDLLNQQVNGNYIFGGTNTTTAPVAVTTASGLIAAGSPTTPLTAPPGVFANNQLKPEAQVDSNLTIAYGQLASDVGGPLLAEIQSILKYDNGSTLGSTLTAAQSSYLTGQINNLAQVSQGVNQATAANGVTQQELSTLANAQNSRLTAAKNFISDIANADVATAVTNVNQDQLALQASYNLIASMSKLTILNYL